MLMGMAGCDSLLTAQLQLAQESQKGVALCRQAVTQRSALVGRLFEVERQRLDEAFDEDVRQQPDFTVEWILEHRRAYAAALDAIARQRAASEKTQETAARNLDAMDEALSRLIRIQRAQSELTRRLWP
jgi:flagellar motility protein MotE (MotC chaperone)